MAQHENLRVLGCLAPAEQDQPDTRTMIRYSKRKDTNGDLALTRSPGEIAAHGPCTEF